jgi:CRISPR/Cas system-associated exonuclease Cas4 (RecB family)
MSSFSVTEVVTATRCPRQLVLLRDGRRVTPYGASIGQAAHAALSALISAASGDPRLTAALTRKAPDAEEVGVACYRLAYAEAYRKARQIAASVDGADLARLDSVVRNLSRLITTLILRAHSGTTSASEVVRKALIATEQNISIDIGPYRVNGRIDLLCHDASTGETWLWDLKTYAGADAAQEEQVRLYALAYRRADVDARPALLHITGDRVEIARAAPLRPDEEDHLRRKLEQMEAWLEGRPPPPPAPDLQTCRACPAQDACWSRWGRTLPDEEGPAVSGTEQPTTPPTPTTLPAPLWLGQMELNRSPARLEPVDLLRHVAVFGAPGAGKTYFAKAIVEEAALAGIPTLVFDVQGDLAQLAQPAKDVPADLVGRRDSYADRIEVRLFTPASDAGLRVSLNPLRLPDASLGEDERAFCLSAMAENLLSGLKVPATWRNVAKNYIAQHLEAAIEEGSPLTLEALIHRVRDPNGLSAEPLLSSRAQREKLVEQLRLLTAGTQRLLFQRGRPLDIGALVLPTMPGKTPLNVVWLNALGDQEAKERFVAMVLSDVYAWMLRNPLPRPQLLLYLDEVGPYMPPSREPASKAILKRMFKEGRKYGVCGLFCTQDFTDVDYKVFSQANTVALGRINSPQNKEKARKILQDVAKFNAQDAVDQLGNAPSGRFLVKCPDRFDGPRWLQGRRLLTHHGSPWGEDEIRAHTSEALRASFR